MTTQDNRAFRATAPIALDTVEAHLDQLLDQAFSGSLSINRIAQLMRGDPRDHARLGNLPPVVEGRILEQAIEILASANADVTVLADCRLPLDPALLERVRTTPTELLGPIRSATGAQTRHGYRPDLILIDAQRQTALLVDIKRSLNSYEGHRIAHLRHRMLAAAVSLPGMLERAGMDVAVRDIRVAVLNLDAAKADANKGIWSLAELDRLVGVGGAAAMIERLRRTFARRVGAQFAAARQVLIEDEVRRRVAATASDSEAKAAGARDPRPPRSRDPGDIIIGLARPADDPNEPA